MKTTKNEVKIMKRKRKSDVVLLARKMKIIELFLCTAFYSRGRAGRLAQRRTLTSNFFLHRHSDRRVKKLDERKKAGKKVNKGGRHNK